MKVHTFKAANAKEAVEAVNQALGPDAVIVNIRKAPKPGWQGLFQSPQVEVSAVSQGQPVGGVGPSVKDSPLGSDQLNPAEAAPFGQVGGRLDIVDDTPIEIPKPIEPSVEFDQQSIESVQDFDSQLSQSFGQAVTDFGQPTANEPFGIESILENIGVLPLQVERLMRLVKRRFPDLESRSIGDQTQYIRHCLVDHWNGLAKEAENNSQSRKVLIGTPGCGKTTALCKWLTQTVLAKRQLAKVWRLDGHMANTSEMLTVHAEMLDVPVERVWQPEEIPDGVVQFFDLPGVLPSDESGLTTLRKFADEIHPAEFLLVLNSAYELEHLINSVRGFSDLPISGLIVTHLDEETRWSKLWNLTLETNLPILYCTGGQDMPGDFVQLTSEMLFRSVMQETDYRSESASGSFNSN